MEPIDHVIVWPSEFSKHCHEIYLCFSKSVEAHVYNVPPTSILAPVLRMHGTIPPLPHTSS